MRRNLWLCFALALAGLVISAAVWSQVPSPMPVHWGVNGEPNGFAPRWLGLLIMPLATFAIPAFVARVSRSAKKLSGSKAMSATLLVTAGFTFFMHALMIHAALRPSMMLSMGALFVAMGLLFVGIGLVMPKLEQNRFAGVRTPWTLGNETNWKLTHRFAALSMGGAGIVCILSGLTLSTPALFWVAFTAIMVGSLLPVGFSYLLHRSRN